MSRIGKKPIPLPKGVTVKVVDGALDVQGPKGKMRQATPPGINFAVDNGVLQASRATESPELAKFHGLARSLAANAVLGVPAGIDIAIDKQTHITVTGVDRQLVGQVAANIRRLREPDPYKQKGVRYTGEVLKKKAGKTGAK